eukprot:CAMPEP_0118953322 /NCGR_PEP_ID=MMETSP1169-20130426/56374_1 /TAXON_ID=36882 /ORGANISM="Pyramimonas obovata, Strain CCMP722" /LENGTH=36 /DNA_ID= /DNA_START= /DNA_END= /DNA_ORIENTATION=
MQLKQAQQMAHLTYRTATSGSSATPWDPRWSPKHVS